MTKPLPHPRPALTLLMLCLALSSTGCGLLFGGNQKVEKKSSNYTHVPLDSEYVGQWRPMETSVSPDGERSDYAYEHIKSGSIISINSACGSSEPRPLEALSRNLIMGLRYSEEPQSITTKVDGYDALETTLTTLHGVKVRAVVLQAQDCAFDIMYVANARHFEQKLPIFDRFVKGFHVTH